MDVTCSLIEIQLKDGFIPLVSLISQNVSMILLNVHLIFLFLIEKKERETISRCIVFRAFTADAILYGNTQVIMSLLPLLDMFWLVCSL